MKKSAEIETEYGLIKGTWAVSPSDSKVIFEGYLMNKKCGLTTVICSYPDTFLDEYGEQAFLDEIKISSLYYANSSRIVRC